MEKKQNPNSHTSHSWSDLPHDLLNLVLERLSFANFQRAKSVCSSWYSASRQSVPNNQIHWLILFPEENNDNTSCTLFNPDEKDRLYKTQDLGEEFAKCECRATYGSWLLMQDPLFNLYIVNLFTNERINLLPVELLWEGYELGVSGRKGRMKSRGGYVRSPVFWIDEKTKDYVVLWGLRDWCVFYSKKGDTSWNQIPQTPDCSRILYKDHKLYFLGYFHSFKIFDLSGEIPQQIFDSSVWIDHFSLRGRDVCTTTLVVTLTGKVLKVEKMRDKSFKVFEVYSSRRRIHSLGDESIFLDQGITVPANDTDGFIKNSIYFSNCYKKHTKDMFIFNLETHKTEPLHTFDSSSFQFSRAQWFVPSFTHR
ncbi:unnamed protein product [Arabidopsis lyrata]|uniref:putative F-box protein At4g22170 n=1 Tax=Arabidopsis lyrata subsp. lyrata TaxID=81972 RepID=UPI000A29C5BD|nr:putative F-box protein At4g22170 [Arabidopsis lyrata subsp. lyrata]CAH8275751.1 unnamed protein product [Arabidopsis lyrata]|eukprot:XP_020873572.1 putative F-box protein At4g22170 [Arabidopsis lyrata subsp. lyrata]